MADTKRLAILRALTNLLAEDVATANGYQHDLAGRVWRGRVNFSAVDTALGPQVTIIEALNPDRDMQVAGWQPTNKDGWILLLQGLAPDDRDNPTDPAHVLMGDVKRALAQIAVTTSPRYMLGGLVAGFAMEPGTVRPPDEASVMAYFYLRVRLTVVEHLPDPYRLD